MKTTKKKKIIKEIYLNVYNVLKKKENSNIKTIIILLIYVTNINHLYLSNKKKYKKNKILNKLWKKFYKIKNYNKIIKNSQVINKCESKNSPIILHNKKFYFNKIFYSKKKIYEEIYKNKIKKKNIKKIKKILKLKSNKNLNKFQKISLIMSIINRITFIIGGPGTGKTTLVTQIILSYIKIFKKKKIKIASTTGKSSSHLLNSIKKNLLKLKIKKNEKKIIPKKSYTIHNLLKINPGIKCPKYNKKNKLRSDLIIIDESSMLDTILLYNLINAIKKKSKIIFLGDFNQLSPINNLNIIKYICKNSKNKFSKKMSNILKNLINYKVKNKEKNIKINDNVCILKKNYRFKKCSEIYKFSKMILKNKIKKIKKKIKKNKFKKILFKKVLKFNSYKKMLYTIIEKYKKYWKYIYLKKSPKKILKEFSKIGVLCAIKHGNFGINKINKNIEKIMKKEKIIKKISNNNKKWYIGRPIIITKNKKSLNLFNGNIGILLKNKNKKEKIFFNTYRKKLMEIPKHIIKEYKTAWSTTIHKSQGSEFKNTIIILPNKKNRVLNKELIYTAITRTKNNLTIFSKTKILIRSIKNK
ncbi:exodeoxyribonuclease V subunit alpha [Buchnera aphidicola (Ceratoglyphina bambusae)]|uniref:exodeoxyribonuclease V subunit alpha n=1 Tax=Buchnera aphidicola TaxID=9 RepID=UPI0031B846FB